MKRTWTWLLSSLLMSGFSPLAIAGQYTAVGLGALGNAKGINSSGQVVGWSVGGSGVFRPFLWSSGQATTDLGTPPGILGAMANGINDHGWVVGVSTDDSPSQAILWRPGQPPVNLGQLLGLESSNAVAINNKGEIVGLGQFHGGQGFGFFWSETTGLVNMGSLGGGMTSPQGINDEGAVVGSTALANGKPHAFLWSMHEEMTDVYPTYPNRTYNAAAVNGRGQIAGMAVMSDGKVLPALWNQPGQDPITPDIDYGWAYDINSWGLVVGVDLSVGTMTPAYGFVWDGANPPEGLPALSQTTGDDDVRAVNDMGWVVGSSINELGQREAVLWIPEPATLSLLALGGLAVIRRRNISRKALEGAEQ